MAAGVAESGGVPDCVEGEIDPARARLVDDVVRAYFDRLCAEVSVTDEDIQAIYGFPPVG